MNSESVRSSVYDCTLEELGTICRELGAPAYRAGQIWRWLYVQWASSWEDMTNLPRSLRDQLAERLSIAPAVAVNVVGDPEGTRKLLLRLEDGDLIESVLILSQGRRTVCVSSQVGCKFACVFCASGKAGFLRNLRGGEIVAQVVHAARELGERPSHIVFMGIGEPFDNYENVMHAVRILNHAEGLNIGARRITISTVGVVPGIQRLAGEGLQLELSVSLHAPNDTVRDRLMPVNRRYSVAEVLDACRAYARATKRIITFEYTLIRGENDGEEHAAELAELLRSAPGRVNLIRLNPIDEYDGEPCSMETVQAFVNVLARSGINATFRDSRGRSVNAACGQLRARELKTAESPTDA